MANWCSFELKAKGKKGFLEKLEQILSYNYKGKCFKRIQQAELIDFHKDDESDDWIATFTGGCGWSICASFDTKSEKGTTLSEFSMDFDVEFEIWSEESCNGFCEHNHYLHGEEDSKVYDLEEEYNEETKEYRYTIKPSNFWEFEYIEG